MAKKRVEYVFEVLDMMWQPLDRIGRKIDNVTGKADNLRKTRLDNSSADRLEKSFDSLGNKAKYFNDNIRRMPANIDMLRSKLERLESARSRSFNPAKIEDYNRKIRETQREIDKLEGKQGSGFFSRMGGGLAASLAPIAIGGMLLAGGVSLGKSSLQSFAEKEQYRIAIDTMLGGKDAGGARMAEYTDIARKTPFELRDVVQAGNKLQGLQRYSRTNLVMLGDLAAATSKPMEQVMNAYAQLASGQKGDATRMFRDLMISNKDWEKFTGKKFKNGEFQGTADEMVDALPKIMQAKGFHGMMINQMQSLKGQASNTKDAMFALQVAIGERMRPAASSFLLSTTKMVDSLTRLVEIPVSQKLMMERAELNALVHALSNVNLREDERKRILDEIQSKYPDFLKGLDLEGDKIGKINEKLRIYNDESRRKIRGQLFKESGDVASNSIEQISIENALRARNIEMARGYLNAKDDFEKETYATQLSGVLSKLKDTRMSPETYLKSFITIEEKALRKNAGNIQKLSIDKALADLKYIRETGDLSILGGKWGKWDRTKPGTFSGEADSTLASSVDSVSSGGSRPTNIHIQLHQLNDKIEVHANNVKESADEIERTFIEMFFRVLNSANAMANGTRN